MKRRFQNRFATVAGVLSLVSAMLSASGGQYVVDVNTDKAAYSPGGGVTLYVDLTNGTGSALNGSVNVTVSHLGNAVTNLPSQSISSLGAHATTAKIFFWTPPALDYQGYLVSIAVLDAGSNVLDSGSCAVDVSSDWAKFPRYGYVAHYDAGLDAYNVAWQLKNYHLNGLQFYDWQWKHHLPYTNAATWPDIANRTISQATVSNLIAAAHGYGMVAMNYNLYGGAYSNYWNDGSGVTLSMGIFKGPPASLANQDGSASFPSGWATTRLYSMSNRDTNWQNYIFGREQTVFANFAFDGWHVDTLGQTSTYDYSGNNFNLTDYHPQFINNAKSALNKRMLFNSSDGVGESQIAQTANVDFIYSELWAANNLNYVSFQQRADNVRSYCSKALVLPAYVNYSKTSGNFNDASVRLADAGIFACGAAHLELGDDTEMLRTEYFPENTLKMSASLKSALRVYYDFLVGYENLLRDGTVSANYAATISGVNTSANGGTNAVWTISRKNLGNGFLHLVNLLNNTSSSWRDTNGTYATPTTQTNLAVKMYYGGNLGGGKLWWASPDTNFGAATQLTYTNGSDGGGSYVNFTLPSLQYWDMVWLELNGTNSALAQIRAQNYDSMAGIGTETTTDTGGGLDVGFVKNLTGDSYVAFNNVDFGSGVAAVSVRVASINANSTVEFRLGSPSGTLIATVPVGNTGGWQSWQTVSAPVSGATGLQKLFVVFKNAEANLNWFYFTAPLPAPWATADVGIVGLAGSASYSGGTFTLNGSGDDIWNAADAFRSVHQAINGPCELRARVTGVQNTDPWAKAGVMIRESLAAGAMNAAVVLTASNGVAFQTRTVTGVVATSTVVSNLVAPQWLRLVRSATNVFAGYYSADGTNWTQIGTSAGFSMSNNAVAGLCVTAHNNAALNASTFAGVSLNQPPVLAAISNRTVLAGVTLAFTNAASDADVPSQALTFSLLAAPTNAVLNASSGVFTWRPAIAQSPSTQTVSVAVADNGLPVMSATQNFVVTVTKPAAPTCGSATSSNGQFQFMISGSTGPDYVIQYSTNLTSWIVLTNITSPTMPFLWSNINSTNFPFGFYRILLGP